MPACVLVIVIGSDVGLPSRLSGASGAFVGWFIMSVSIYSLRGSAPITGVDLDSRGRPRGDHVYRSRSRDPIYRLLDRDPSLPLPFRIRAAVGIVSGAGMSAVISTLGTQYQAAAVIVALALVSALFAMAGIATSRRRRNAHL